jgi:catechol 2,3-dioxygenase-like lactoylglutathione lyase family enzyme
MVLGDSAGGGCVQPFGCILGKHIDFWPEGKMISGAHIIVYSKDAEADRAFFRDVLGFQSVDAGHRWLIFALPPAEAAFHPSHENGGHELYLMCDDLKAEMASFAKKQVQCSEVKEERWGSITKIRLPGGGELGLYQPKHPTALVKS